MAGRNHFRISDDQNMLRFLIDELKKYTPEAKNPKGLEIWLKAERRKITNHSHQSMNSRFRKQILPNLNLQPISIEEKKYLVDRLCLNMSIDDEDDKSGQEVDDDESNKSKETKNRSGDDVSKRNLGKKRPGFTKEDDLILLSFVVDEIKRRNPKADKPAGLALWKYAEAKNILPERSVWSMQIRFVRHLWPNLDILNYIPDETIEFLKKRLTKSSRPPKPVESNDLSSPTEDETALKVKGGLRGEMAKKPPGIRLVDSPDMMPVPSDEVLKDFIPPANRPAKKKMDFLDSESLLDNLGSSPAKNLRSAKSPLQENNCNREVEALQRPRRRKRLNLTQSDEVDDVQFTSTPIDAEANRKPENNKSEFHSTFMASVDLVIKKATVEKILEKGGDLGNETKVTPFIFDRIMRKRFGTADDVRCFVEKFRAIEALAHFYEKSVEDVLILVKTCKYDLKSVEEHLREKSN